MEINNLRLKALARLAQSTTGAAKSALLVELDEVAECLKTQSDYDVLFQNLEILNVIGYCFSDKTVSVIASFIQTIEGRKLTYAQGDDAYSDYIAKYRNAHSLIVKAVEVVVRLRYYETRAVLCILLVLHDHPVSGVRKKVLSGLDSLAKYDLDVFYGTDRQGGLGPAPQEDILGTLEAMDNSALTGHREALLRLLAGMLSPILEGVSWTYRSATISQGTIPALPSVSDVRTRSIKLLIRLYFLAETTHQKLAIINALNTGTRIDNHGAANDEARNMIAIDSAAILDFFARLVSSEDFQVVQKIESSSYWIFRHPLNEEVKAVALEVEKAVATNKEYAIYRVLIGFEGVFGDWSVIESGQYEAIEKERRQNASDFAHAITEDTYSEWRTRILAYAKTDSEDFATFPVFYYFLAEFASARPELALKLITEDSAGMARFLIPVLSSLWNGACQEKVRILIDEWIGRAESDCDHYLFPVIKMFLSTKTVDIELIAHLLEKVAKINDVSSVRQIVTVAIARWYDVEAAALRRVLFCALDVLTEMKDASWIIDAWFRKEAKEMFSKMDSEGAEKFLRNLIVLDKIDYHAEEILYSLGQKNPERILHFLIERIEIEVGYRSCENERIFDAIPFEFNKLHELLSKIPEVVVRSVLEQYRADSAIFGYRSAKLLKSIFSDFSEEFEASLLQLVLEGGNSNLEFVLGVLRNYHGEPFLHRLCKEIVKKADTDSSLLSDVVIALESTGVVSGEFGMADAYERKRLEVLDWLSDPNEKIKIFARRYVAELEQMRDIEAKRAQEGIALGERRFGGM